jgi:electron transport complex protein RnfG
MKINKEIIKLGITLMIVTTLATVALSVTNELTKSKIEKQEEIQLLYSLAEVMPEADNFKEGEDYYNAYSNGELIGRVLKVNAPGYSSTIQLIAGVNLENKITKVVVLNHVETPGLGANVEKNEFLGQFTGKMKGDLVIKKEGGSIDAITGATISSRAVADGIRSMIDRYTGGDGVTGATPMAAIQDVGDVGTITNAEEDEHEEDDKQEDEPDDDVPTGAAVYVEYLNKKLSENE